MDYRAGYDQSYIAAHNLNGADKTVTISKVESGKVVGSGGKSAKKLIVTFSGEELQWVCPKTCAKTIAAMFGKDTNAWLKKQITLFPTQAQLGGETVEAIRVRPVVPK
jgi:predicted metal-dependent hydrolase